MLPNKTGIGQSNVNISHRRRSNMLRIFIIGLLVGMLSIQTRAEKSTREIYEASKGAVVLLLAYDSRGMPSSLGSGFFFETNRIASNQHVVDGASRVVFRVIGSKDVQEVKRIASVSRALDLAILEVEHGQRPLKIVGIEKLAVGDKVVAIGNPRGLEGSVSEGIVSGVRGSDEIKIIQITAPISPGSSGGPLFTAKGDVVGVTTATLKDSQSLNFAVPASLLLTLREKGKEWEPAGAKALPAHEKGNAGVRLVSPELVPGFDWLSYSLLNESTRPIQNVAFLLIIKAKESGDVVHFLPLMKKDVLPPGLARRYREVLDPSLDSFYNASIELRILHYDFVGDSGESGVLESLTK